MIEDVHGEESLEGVGPEPSLEGEDPSLSSDGEASVENLSSGVTSSDEPSFAGASSGGGGFGQEEQGAITAEIEVPVGLGRDLEETRLGEDVASVFTSRSIWWRSFLRALLSLSLPVLAGAGVTWWLVKDLPEEQVLDRAGTVLSSGVAARSVADALASRVDVLRTLASQGTIVDEISVKNEKYRGSEEVVRRIVQGVDAEWRAAFAQSEAPPRPVVENSGSRSLRSFATLFPGFRSMLATDMYGAATSSTEILSQYDYSASPWFSNVMASGQVEVSTEFSPANEALFRVSLPMSGAGPYPAGVLRALLEPAAVLAPALHHLEAEGFKVMVVGHQGELVFRSGEGADSAPVDARLLEVATADVASAGTTSVEIADGRMVFASGAKVPRIDGTDTGSELGWKVIVVRDAATLSGLVEAQDSQQFELLVLVGGVCTALVVLLAVWLSRPFRHLSEVPAIVENHLWRSRVSVRGGLGDVAESINDLLIRAGGSEAQQADYEALVRDADCLSEQAERFVEGDQLTVFRARVPKFEPLAVALSRLRDEVGSRLVTLEEGVEKVCSSNDLCKDDLSWAEKNQPAIGRSQELKVAAASVSEKLEGLALHAEETVRSLHSELGRLFDRWEQESQESRREVRSALARQRQSEAGMDRATGGLDEVREAVLRLRDLGDRTNVLALNGSIQAALGGQAGRAFAIIAGELEQLCKQSTELAGATLSMLKEFDGESRFAQQELGELGNNLTVAESTLRDGEKAARELRKKTSDLSERLEEVSGLARKVGKDTSALAADAETQERALGLWKEHVVGSSDRRRRVTEGLAGLLGLTRRMRRGHLDRGSVLMRDFEKPEQPSKNRPSDGDGLEHDQ